MYCNGFDMTDNSPTCIDCVGLVVQRPLEIVNTPLEGVPSGRGFSRDAGDHSSGGNHKQLHDYGDETTTDAAAAQQKPLVQLPFTKRIPYSAAASRSFKRTRRCTSSLSCYFARTVMSMPINDRTQYVATFFKVKILHS